MKQSVLIITIFILGYLLAIIFRSINGILAPNLIADINLTASSLGFLTSTLLIAHALAQIPLGVYLDSHGPKSPNNPSPACRSWLCYFCTELKYLRNDIRQINDRSWIFWGFNEWFSCR